MEMVLHCVIVKYVMPVYGNVNLHINHRCLLFSVKKHYRNQIEEAVLKHDETDDIPRLETEEKKVIQDKALRGMFLILINGILFALL